MYIKLTSTPDKSGECHKVFINSDRVLGMVEGVEVDFFNKVRKDEQGYPETFTEICTRGRSFFVMETVDEVERIMRETMDAVVASSPNSWVTQQNV